MYFKFYLYKKLYRYCISLNAADATTIEYKCQQQTYIVITPYNVLYKVDKIVARGIGCSVLTVLTLSSNQAHQTRHTHKLWAQCTQQIHHQHNTSTVQIAHSLDTWHTTHLHVSSPLPILAVDDAQDSEKGQVQSLGRPQRSPALQKK